MGDIRLGAFIGWTPLPPGGPSLSMPQPPPGTWERLGAHGAGPIQGIPSVLPAELRVGTQHQKSRRGGVQWAPQGLAGDEGVTSPACAKGPGELQLPSAPPGPDAWVADEKTEASNQSPLPVLLPRGGQRPRALSEASSLAWAAPLSQAPVPSQLHIRLAQGARELGRILAHPEGLGGRRDPEDMNKYGWAVPGGSWPSPGWEGKPGLVCP